MCHGADDGDLFYCTKWMAHTQSTACCVHVLGALVKLPVLCLFPASDPGFSCCISKEEKNLTLLCSNYCAFSGS